MIEVTCAIIRNDEDLVLVVRRSAGMSNGGKWEFPGGKIRPGEDHEDCIIREIHEELTIDIIITGTLDSVEHNYDDKSVRLIPFICDTLASKPHLTEHDEYRWVKPSALISLDLTAADIPVARQYAAQYSIKPETHSENAINTVPGEPMVSLSEPGDEMTKVLGRISSTAEISMVARSAVNDSVLLSHLVALSSSNEKRVGFMASWALSKVSDININLLSPYLPSLVDTLPYVANESVQRSFMRIIMKSDMGSLPASHHVKLIDYCMNIMRSEQQAVAPKAYGMEILSNMAAIYPDIANEVAVAVQLAISEGSPGIKAMGRKAIMKLSRR